MAGRPDPLLRLMQRLHDEGVRYIPVGGRAVRLNGIEVDGVPIVTLDIAGPLETKTTFRDKDRIDREAPSRPLAQLREPR